MRAQTPAPQLTADDQQGRRTLLQVAADTLGGPDGIEDRPTFHHHVLSAERGCEAVEEGVHVAGRPVGSVRQLVAEKGRVGFGDG